MGDSRGKKNCKRRGKLGGSYIMEVYISAIKLKLRPVVFITY